MLIAILGVVKAGGAYLPVDPAFPRDRQAFMLDDAKVPVLLTSAKLAAGLPSHAAIQLCLDTEWDSIPSCSKDNPEVLAGPGNLAYVLYTSGSTGRPKGVMITHRNLVNFLESMRREPGLTGKDILVAVTTLSFDIAGLELWLPLCVGARVVIASRNVAMDGVQLAALLHASGATMMQATPATWRLLLETGWAGEHDLVALCGGEALPAALAAALLPRCQSLWNMYGPTETTIWSTIGRVTADGNHLPRPSHRKYPDPHSGQAAAVGPHRRHRRAVHRGRRIVPRISPSGRTYRRTIHSRPLPANSPEQGSTRPETSPDDSTTAASNTSDESMIRSRSEDSASNSVRSKPSSQNTPRPASRRHRERRSAWK